MKYCLPLVFWLTAVNCGTGAQQQIPNVRLLEWERGYAIESRTQPGMAVYLWFYEWNMFEAMRPGQHTAGTYQLQRTLSDDGRQATISAEALKLQMSATTDGAELTLTVRNLAQHDFPPHAAIVPCFNPGPEGARNGQFVSTNSYFLGPQGLEKLLQRQIHYNARLRGLVDQEAKAGPLAWNNKWPMAEPNSAGGLLVRESNGGRWACGIAWEDWLSAQGHNPWQCMHLSVCIGPLKRGESKTIRGKVYLIRGDKDELLRRYRKDFAATSPGR